MIDAETGWYFMHASIKGVVLSDEGVLLCRNPRGKWELPGGWPDREDRTLAEVVRREVREECGLDVEVGQVVGAEIFEIAGGKVLIVAVSATAEGPVAPRASEEHSEVRFFPLDRLPEDLEDGYEPLILAARARR
ncbi:ADP-ribose pyrophosphatase YjhB (NUDIX family) [Thermocatellispora tengchongensis]|uniref:ADP-ribose pyrophosphatase YjhB (NUDIX family) n=1 Tax=Thermocatellispora tengchongensis TaxID=1073253 RepID=A0A840PLW5_9ACTN|nr:NUDIX domain-containing protein [Thermocatellispora tengchongensis]MBB5139939.1 ADP-ribose pyrophosphatase YjhB (NUDIX family) [Thermocatellispora tengchongensis]